MLKNKAETKEFIKTLFHSSEIEINGISASHDDLVKLCERVSGGKESIRAQKQYISDNKIQKICVTTF